MLQIPFIQQVMRESRTIQLTTVGLALNRECELFCHLIILGIKWLQALNLLRSRAFMNTNGNCRT